MIASGSMPIGRPTGWQAPGSTVCGAARRRDAAAGPACDRLRLRRRRENRRAARRDLVQGAHRQAARCAGQARLRSFPRHPLQAGSLALAPRGAAVRDRILSRGTELQGPGQDQRAGRRRRARSAVQSRAVRLRRQRHRSQGDARPRLRGISRALRDQFAEVQGRGRRVSRRQLFSRARQRPALRIVGARPCRRHGARLGRGVSAVRRVLDQTAGARCDRAHDLCAARLPAHDRRLQLRRQARRRHRSRCQGSALPARIRQQARLRAADDDVFLRRKPARGPRRLPSRSPRLGRPVGRVGNRRMDLAAAGQSQAAAGDVVCDGESVRIRHHAARPRLRALRGSGSALRPSPQRMDRAERTLGNRQSRAGADSQSRRDQ